MTPFIAQNALWIRVLVAIAMIAGLGTGCSPRSPMTGEVSLRVARATEYQRNADVVASGGVKHAPRLRKAILEVKNDGSTSKSEEIDVSGLIASSLAYIDSAARDSEVQLPDGLSLSPLKNPKATTQFVARHAILSDPTIGDTVKEIVRTSNSGAQDLGPLFGAIAASPQSVEDSDFNLLLELLPPPKALNTYTNGVIASCILDGWGGWSEVGKWTKLGNRQRQAIRWVVDCVPSHRRVDMPDQVRELSR